MPTGSIYTPLEVYTVLRNEASKHGKPNLINVVRGTGIVLRESGGNARAFRDASKNPDGGNDRGWWQFNDKYHTDVSDIVAYDPIKSTAVAWIKSEGFTKFGPWRKDGKLTIPLEQMGLALDAAFTYGDKLSLEDQLAAQNIDASSTPIDDVKDMAANVVDSLTPGWMESLAAVLSNLLDPQFWKRIGIVVLGALIIIAGLMLFFGVSPQELTPTGAAMSLAEGASK